MGVVLPFKRKVTVVQAVTRVVKKIQEMPVYKEMERSFAEGCCSCHINPPCDYCISLPDPDAEVKDEN